jgi:alginate lyase
MKHKIILISFVFGFFISAKAADLTNGWSPEPLHFEIQSPYNLKHSERYAYDAARKTYHLWVFNTDKPDTKSSTRPPRTEMSLEKYTSGRHQFEADVMVATNTSRVSIMQIFGGEDHHATSLQLRVYNGALKEYEHTTLLSNIYGQWFHLNVTHDVATHEIQVFINGNPAFTNKDHGGKEWHFKCGVYAQEKPSHKMEVFYRNIKIYKGDQ